MQLQPFWSNILLWCIFIVSLPASHEFKACENLPPCCAFAMTTKLHQKLLEDIRLQKRLLGLIDDQNKDHKERRGSYQSRVPPPPQVAGIETYYKRWTVRGEDDGDKTYEWGVRRNSSRRRADAIDASSSRHELFPTAYETRTTSKPITPFPEFFHSSNLGDYHRQRKVNSINKNAAGSSGFGARYRNSDRAINDGGLCSNSIQKAHNHVASYNHYDNNSRNYQENRRQHHHQRRSLDLGEVSQQCFSDSDIVQSNEQARSYLQLREISRDAKRLGDLLSDKHKRSGDVGRDLLKGAMDLEESLRILAKLQKVRGSVKPRQSFDLKVLPPYSHRVLHEEPQRQSFEPVARHSFDGRELGKSTTSDLRDAIRASLNRQKMMYSKNNDGGFEKFNDGDFERNNVRHADSIPGSNSGALQVENKKRIPNVIARLMGLEELPPHSQSKPNVNSNSNSNSVSDRAAGRTDLPSLQAKRSAGGGEQASRGLILLKPEKIPTPQESIPRPALQSARPRNSAQSAVCVKDEQYQDTIKAALKRIKQEAPRKLSFQEELSEKLKRLHSVESQNPEKEPKTLKQILETMQVKGILHPVVDQEEKDHMEREVKVLKPVTDVQKPARKFHEQVGSLPENEASMIRNTKVVSKDPPQSPSPIVIIKPVIEASAAVVQQVQSPLKATELHPKSTAPSRTKKGNLVNSTESKKKKPSKSELVSAADDGQSKKSNANNSAGSIKTAKQRTRARDDGSHQKQFKPPSPPPPPDPFVLQELRKRRGERISKANNNKVLEKKSSSTPKQRYHQKAQSKAKESVSRSRPILHEASTDRISSDSVRESERQNPQIPIEASKSAVSKNVSTNEDNNNEEKSHDSCSNKDQTLESPKVEIVEPTYEEETTDSELSSPTLQHNYSIEESASVTAISTVSVLKLPAKAGPLDEEEEEDDEEIDEEKEQQEDLSSLPTHFKDSDEKSDRFQVDSDDKTVISEPSIEYPSNYAKENEFDGREMDYRDYVCELLTENPAFMDAEPAEPTELYPRLFLKLQQQQAVSFDGGKGRQARDALEQMLVLDCVRELLKRKSRMRLQMRQPVKLSRMSRASFGLTGRKGIQETVQELSDDIVQLKAYEHAGSFCDDVENEKFGSDFIYSVLKRDLNTGSVGINNIWSPAWDNGMFGEEEAQEIGTDIEKLVLDELVEEVILDHVLIL